MPNASPLLAPVAADDARIDPIDLTPAQQQMLRTLADIDRSYGEVRQKLERWSGPDALKQRFFEQLEARRRSSGAPPYACPITRAYSASASP
jgi:hypothetical protein